MDTENLTTGLQHKNELLAAQVTAMAAQISKRETLIKYYENQLLLLKRRQFGSSSEKFHIDDADYCQLGLFNEAEACANKTLPEPEFEDISYKRKKRVGKHEEDLSGLPVERIDHELPEAERACPQCGESMPDIGVTIRRELKLILAKVIVVEHASHTYACANCQKNSDKTPIIKPHPRAVDPRLPCVTVFGGLYSSAEIL